MAQPNSPSTAEPQNAPPQDSFAIPLTTNNLEYEAENPDDWEYEYSTTETETYYLTLDLATPEVAPMRRARTNEESGQIRAKWLNPTVSSLKRKTVTKQSARKANEDPAWNTPQSEAESLAGSASQERETHSVPGKVQIMGLHTNNPFVSRNGHVYSCQWASNIGTELLFMANDPDRQIPTLRKLAGGVNLLAASSARIISNSVVLEPKPQMRIPEPTGTLKSDAQDKHSGTSIPVGHASSEKRKNQARFLGQLIALKEAKGEKDEVTVHTQKRLSSTGWRAYLKEKRNEERSRLRKTIKSKTSNVEDVEKAKERLAELDAEEDKMKDVEKKWLDKSHPREEIGRKRSDDSAVQVSRKKVRTEDDENLGGIIDAGIPWEESGSMPSPQRSDMEEEAEGYIGEYDEEFGGGIFDEEEEYGDEDAPEEDEESQMAYGWNDV